VPEIPPTTLSSLHPRVSFSETELFVDSCRLSAKPRFVSTSGISGRQEIQHATHQFLAVRLTQLLARIAEPVTLRARHVQKSVSMKKFLLLATALAFLPACRTNHRQSAGSTAPIAEVFANYYEDRFRLYPIEATLAGDNRYNDSLPNPLTESFRSDAKAFYRKYLAALNRYDRAALSREDQMSYDLLKWECDINLAQLQFPTHLLPLDQFNSINALHLQFGQWAGGTGAQPFKTVEDYDNWLKRVDAFIGWCDTAVVNMREGMARGYVLPKALTCFRYAWEWDGQPTEIASRAVDETGYVQPEMSAIQRVRGRRTRYHLNPVTGWTIGADGRVRFAVQRVRA